MRVVIVGNGVAGATCARELRRADASVDITLVGGETEYFFSRTALMYAFMDKMQRRDLEPHERRSWKDHRITLVHGVVKDVDAAAKHVTLADGKRIPFDKLVLALGAVPRRADWPGLPDVKDGLVTFVSMQDLDAAEAAARTGTRAVVVGGGLIGIELVECFLHARLPTAFLVREPWYWPMALGAEEAEMVEAHMRAHGVEVITGDEVARVEADGAGRVKAVHTAGGRALPCNVLGMCIGVVPRTGETRGWATAPELGRGIRVDAQLRTSLPDVYAAGDCAEIHRQGAAPLLETIWYSAKRQGALVARNLLGAEESYAPPTFFNSSKLFDIEFTTVGSVMDAPEGSPTLFMRLPGKNACLRVVHEGTRVLGFNVLGMRVDHGVLSRWVEEKRDAAFVRAHLREAQFDVELGRVPLERMDVTTPPLRRPGRPA